MLTPFLDMARPARFERATAWFVARYSIQLSYGRKRDADYWQLLMCCQGNRWIKTRKALQSRAFEYGGERGIRTLDRVSPIRP
jgi:hypothetical protein